MKKIVLFATLITIFPLMIYAQAVKPYVLILFDTSGSMTENPQSVDQYCDGSNGLPCNGDGKNSKMYTAKSVLSSLVQSFQSKISFGLARFYQKEGVSNPSSAYGGRVINYDGSENCQKGGEVLVPIGDGNIQDILNWMDNNESYPQNKELRADGSTPLELALLSMRDYFSTQVLASDTVRDCRPYFVILLTDGEETCGGDPVGAVMKLRATQYGQNYYDIKTFVVGYGDSTRGAQSLNDMAVAGGTAVNNKAYSASDPQTLSNELNKILNITIPKEICDGIDNDCNGITDDGLTRECEGACNTKGTESCVNGKWVNCTAPSFGDEGKECNTGLSGICSYGVYRCEGTELKCIQIYTSSQEVCDGIDNDCDGFTDEDDNNKLLRRPCANQCGTGNEYCLNGKWDEKSCDAPKPNNGCGGCGPTPQEICDGMDNNCNGEVDEGKDICGGDAVCYRGQCVVACVNNECPTGRRCNKEGWCLKDDRCFDVVCEEGKICQNGDCIDPCASTVCPEGWICKNGACLDGTCYVMKCDQDKVCKDAQCIDDPCKDKSCQSDEFCRDGDCVKSCYGVKCEEGKKCVDGSCVEDKCYNIKCDAYKVCKDGECVDDKCWEVMCAWGRICKDGNCVDDPCFRIKCPDPAVCYDGQCIDEKEVPTQDAGFDFGPALDILTDEGTTKDDKGGEDDIPSISDVRIEKDAGVERDMGSSGDESSSSCSCNLIE